MPKRSAKPAASAAKQPTPLRLEYLDPAQLDDNPSNWRLHPASQLSALNDLIAEVGWAGALLYNERTKRLIDGHGRKELFAGKGAVPVLVGSWTPAQEKLILATLDPLAALAEPQHDKLAKLVSSIDVGKLGSESVSEILKDLVTKPNTESPSEAPPAVAPGENGFTYAEQFAVIVVLQSEAEQQKAYARLCEEGWTCRVVNV